LVTFETMRLIRDELGVNQCCGAGNVSFGLPQRTSITAAFLPVAISCGLTSAITDVTRPPVCEAILAADLLFGRDEYASRWLTYYREMQKARDVASDHISAGRPEHARA
jgi:5-methyltetrahydrofolate--homocysteine methyltransferase